MALSTLRIFISSPGDVAEERLIARRVIRRLGAQLGSAIQLEAIAWENAPLVATATFQDQLMRPSSADVLIAILWSRLGTALPSHIRRADGSAYASGTEFEFEDAIAGHQRSGKPEIIAYRKTAVVPTPFDPSLLEEHLRQKQALAGFVSRWFVNTEDGSLKAAFHNFESPGDFEELLESHLTGLIEPMLPAGVRAQAAVAWRQGSPFRGLAPFGPEHAQVYFGRTGAVAQVLMKLRLQADRSRAFVLIVGMSGGGKSSLIRAGVLPLLLQPGVVGTAAQWRHATLRPSDGSGDLTTALRRALAQPTALPGLDVDPNANAATWVAAVAGALDSFGPGCQLALVVDQLEEIFSDSTISATAREAFVDMLDGFARSGRAVVLATLRSDIYPRLVELPTLIALKEGDGQHDLLPPTPREIGQIIRLPALAAGLGFEVQPNTSERLDETIRDAAAKNPGALPLLQFLLEELYQRRSSENVLTFRAYEELGGVEGALAQRAEAVLSSVSVKAQQTLNVVLRELVTFGADDESQALRRVAPRSAFATPQASELVDALLEGRLLVSTLDEQGQAVVSLAHEALLEFWPRLRQWREQDRELILLHARLAAAARNWDVQQRSDDFLLASGKPLTDARALVGEGMRLSPIESAFVLASEQRSRTLRRLRVGAVAGLVVLTMLAGVAAYLATVESERARTQATTAQMTTDFMGSLFSVADPKENRGDQVTVREMLDRGVQQIEGGLAGQQAVRSNLMRAMGQAYNGLGLYPQAQKLLAEALVQAEQSGAPADVLKARLALAANRYLDGDFPAAQDLYRVALDAAIALHGQRHPSVSEALVGLGENLLELGKPEEAERLYRRAIAIDLELHGEQHADTARSVGALAQLLYFQTRYADAEPVFRRALAIQKALYGDRHVNLASSMNDLGSLMFQTGRYQEAVAVWTEALPVYRKVYGTEHHQVATILNNLGRVELMRGNLPAAEGYLDEALAMDRKLLQPNHEDLILPLNSMAMLRLAGGKPDAAERLLNEALRIAQPRKHWMLNQVLGNFADLYQATARGREAGEALTLARAAMAAQYGEQLGGSEAWRRAVLDVFEAAQHIDARRYPEAEKLLLGAVGVLEVRFGRESFYVNQAHTRLVRLYASWGKPEQRDRYQKRLTPSR